MTQANINLPNSAGNIFRANNNSALSAIMSNNAGPNPPGSPDVGWMWLDTNTPTATLWTMNIYTGASWLPIFHVDATTGTVFPVQGIPVGASLEWNSDALPPGYLFEYGQAISRSAYPLLFVRLGTTWGAGDGTSTFNVPDSRDVVTMGKGNMGGADRGLVTAAVVGFNPLTLGAFGGSQLAQLPRHHHDFGAAALSNINVGQGGIITVDPGSSNGIFSLGPSVGDTGTVNASGMQPTIVKNKIIFTGVFA